MPILQFAVLVIPIFYTYINLLNVTPDHHFHFQLFKFVGRRDCLMKQNQIVSLCIPLLPYPITTKKHFKVNNDSRK